MWEGGGGESRSENESEDARHQLEGDDGHHRAEIQPSHGWDELAEQGQEGLADLAQGLVDLHEGAVPTGNPAHQHIDEEDEAVDVHQPADKVDDHVRPNSNRSTTARTADGTGSTGPR